MDTVENVTNRCAVVMLCNSDSVHQGPTHLRGDARPEKCIPADHLAVNVPLLIHALRHALYACCDKSEENYVAAKLPVVALRWKMSVFHSVVCNASCSAAHTTLRR